MSHCSMWLCYEFHNNTWHMDDIWEAFAIFVRLLTQFRKLILTKVSLHDLIVLECCSQVVRCTWKQKKIKSELGDNDTKKKTRKILNSLALVHVQVHCTLHNDIQFTHKRTQSTLSVRNIEKEKFQFSIIHDIPTEVYNGIELIFSSCRHYVHCYICKVCGRFVVRIRSNDTNVVWKLSCHDAECISSASRLERQQTIR